MNNSKIVYCIDNNMLVKLELLTNKYTTLLLNRANENISLTFHLLKYVGK